MILASGQPIVIDSNSLAPNYLEEGKKGRTGEKGEVFTSTAGHSNYLGVGFRAQPEFQQYQVRRAKSAPFWTRMRSGENVFVEQTM
jgi:hypothetical protein